MFWRILKKDLKRKRTMNIILLLFIILCSMFASSSLNNIAAVTGGLDRYFDLAGVPDIMITINGESDTEEKLREMPSVKEIKKENLLSLPSSKNFTYKGKKLENFINPAALLADDEVAVRCFDKDNILIEDVPGGCFYSTRPFVQNIDISEGDYVDVNVGDTSVKLKYMGIFKDAVLYTDNASLPWLLIDRSDYERLSKEQETHDLDTTKLYLKTDDPDSVRELAAGHDNVYITERSEFKQIYLYDMFAAYIMMAVSIILMITAFVVLRFTIGFTISEEFREIGVMKAVGVSNISIRSLYIVKYLAIAVIGAAAGFFASIPLSSMMLDTVSKNIVLSGSSGTMTGLLSTAGVVIAIMLFCFLCTRSVNKLSPIDAVRNGQTGERFRKKSLLHLGRSKLPATGFLSVNDVTSAPKRFSIITVVFTLCLLMMTLMSMFALTLQSENLRRLFLIPASEAHIMDADMMMDYLGDNDTEEKLTELEKTLSDNGMPGKCTITLTKNFDVNHGDKKLKCLCAVTSGHTDEILRVDEGSAPRRDDEIAVTESTMKELGVGIGDRISFEYGGREQEFIITGRFSAFITSGIYLNKNYRPENESFGGCMGIQVHFDGSPDKETIGKNIEKLKDILDTTKIYTTSEYVKTMTDMSDVLTAIKHMMMILTVIVTGMIVILMERSFISKEKSEIALMKAMGISSGSIIGQHTLRFVIVALAACAAGFALQMPVGNLLMNMVCRFIGDVEGIVCDVDIFEVFVVCPLILIGVTAIGAFLTALYTRTISAADAASIE